MLKKPFNQLFNGDRKNTRYNLRINLNLRPQNLDFDNLLPA